MDHQKTSSPGSDGRLPGLSTTVSKSAWICVRNSPVSALPCSSGEAVVGDLRQARRVPLKEGLCLHVVFSVFGSSLPKWNCSDGGPNGAGRGARSRPARKRRPQGSGLDRGSGPREGGCQGRVKSVWGRLPPEKLLGCAPGTEVRGRLSRMRMAVRQGHGLLDLLEVRRGESDAVDIAVAWAAPCLAIGPKRRRSSSLCDRRWAAGADGARRHGGGPGHVGQSTGGRARVDGTDGNRSKR